jgi:hypothetical protein
MPAPTDNLEWGTDASAQVVEPSAGFRVIGWIRSRLLPAEKLNWWMRGVWRWIAYYGTKDAADGIVGLDASKRAAVAATTGNGITATTAAGNGNAVVGTGHGTGSGVQGTGGASNGIGVKGTGGASNGIGVEGTGDGTGAGAKGTGGDSSGPGVEGTGGAPNGIGVKGTGTGNGPGVQGTGSAGGSPGVHAVATSGYSLKSEGISRFEATGSEAINVVTNNTGNAFGVEISESGTGGGIRIATAGSPVRAALALDPSNQPSGPNDVGDMYVTAAGVLKICTVAGTPGTWVSVGAQV